MANIPVAPQETGTNKREIGFMTEDDGASALRAVLSTTAGFSEEINGQRCGPLAVGGYTAHDAAKEGNSVPVAGVYRLTRPQVNAGDVVDMMTNPAGCPRVVGEGNHGEQMTTPDDWSPVLMGARASSTEPSATGEDDLTMLWCDTNGRLHTIVEGAAADDAAAAGNPVQIGVKYEATPDDLNDGDIGYAMGDIKGRMIVNLPSTDTANVGAGSNDITDSSEQVVAAYAGRRAATFVNYSSVWIFLGMGVAAVAGAGIALAPNGGSFEINATNLFTGAVYAIAASAGSNRLCYAEW